MNNELTLKDLLGLLKKQWKLVVTTTIITFLAVVTGSILLNNTTFTGEISGKISFTEKYNTSLGVYIPKEEKAIDILNYVLENDFNDYIEKTNSINNDEPILITTNEGDEFAIKVNAQTSTAANSALNVIKSNLESYINYKLQSDSIAHFQNLTQSEITKELRQISLINRYIERLNAMLIQTIPDSDSNKLFSEYSSLQSKILDYKINQNLTNERINQYQQDIKMLEMVDYDSFEQYKSGENHFDEVSVDIEINPEINMQENDRFNLIVMGLIGLVLGSMLGIFIVFFINYWKSNT